MPALAPMDSIGMASPVWAAMEGGHGTQPSILVNAPMASTGMAHSVSAVLTDKIGTDMHVLDVLVDKYGL